MFSMDAATLALAAAVLVLGGFVKGVTGLGLPLVIVSVMSMFVPVKTVLGIAILPVVLTNIWQVATAGGFREPLKRFWPMILVLIAGLWVGSSLVVALDTRVLIGIIGFVVVTFSALGLARPPGRLPPRWERPGGAVAAAIAGVCGGLSTVWGPPITIYMLLLDLKKDEFVRSVGLMWFLGAIPLGLMYVANGILNEETAVLSALACVPAFLALMVGQAVRKRIPQEKFRRVLMVMLLLIGLNLIRRAVF